VTGRTRALAIALVVLAGSPARAQEPPAATCPCPPKPAEPPVWTGSAGFGLSLNRGNTDTTNVSLSAAATRDPKTRDVWKFQALYLRGDTSGTATADRLSASARYERSLNKRVFVFGDLAYLRDRFKSIDYLVAPSGGIGYRLVSNERVEFAADTGLGMKWEKNPGLDVRTSAVFTAGDKFEYKLSPTAKITQSFAGLWDVDEWGDALHTFACGVAASMTTRSQLKLEVLDTYATRPPSPDIKHNDVALLAALVYKF
jgi:putative salt-induced outer membrane protein